MKSATGPQLDDSKTEEAQEGMLVSVVLPVFNEQDSLPELHERLSGVLRTCGRDYEIILVDDGSRDNSFPVLTRIAEADPHVRVIKFTRNFGQTHAMAAGIDLSKGDVIVTMDADLQNDPQDIPRLLDELEKGYDCVSGWREQRQDRLWTRKLPSWAANWLISFIFGVPLHDYGCSLKAYSARFLKSISLYGEMHRFVPALIAWQGGRVSEIPVQHHARTRGISKYGLGRVPKVILDVILLKFMSGFSTRPLHFFGAIGLVAMAGGGAVGVTTWYYRYVLDFRGVDLLPLVLLTMLLLIMGGHSILMGLIAEINIRTYYECQDKKPYVTDRVINP
jgi:glycosyltransferase involved in cell wall biosynthesis